MVIPPGFLDAIIANPGEDSARLIAADWLCENGQGDWSEFIRVQCRIAEIGRGLKSEEDCELPACLDCAERRALQARERELFEAINIRLPGGPFMLRTDDRPCPSTHSVVFRRGFVAEVSLRLASWLAHGPEIVRRQPVEVVRISDRKLFSGVDGWWGWFDLVNGHEYNLPPEVFGLLSNGDKNDISSIYNTEAAAIDDLSRACLAWGKGRYVMATA